VTSWTHFLSAQEGAPAGGLVRSIAIRLSDWTIWVTVGIYLGCLTAFVADLTSADTLAFGVFYVPGVATAVFYRDRRAVWILTTIACAMVIVGTFIPAIAPDVGALIWNRALSLCAVLATAMFVRHARVIQDRLAEQTRRAAAAERIKSDVLTNLSEEIRAPLHSMIGVLELVAADSRGDHQTALGMVRSSGRRLVTTVDNLVDLTQLDDRSMPPETIDLARLLPHVVEASRFDAVARQTILTIEIPSCVDLVVRANGWGLRRILENKIADAITNTPPGGRVDIGVLAEPDHRTVVIAATGTWPPGAFESAADTNRALLMPAVMGLALSQRLAKMMGAQLVFAQGPGEGTTVRLRLPAAAGSEARHA
jgi:signal transduction histidine kinase